ncbi:hypothetical protein Sango_1220800 [Sesamum angolense]|uniref:Uncharacterized protein n=1 Tax=Sesamum angolense TaxID=2727404 RepID=A0AAE2BX98_9LAMI|nr:hypothetical protein Sango_1220800 [Sesamum angolense]
MSGLVKGRRLAESHGDGEANEEGREHLGHLQKEAFQLAHFYYVFQGVMFTSFLRLASTFKCHYRWIPRTLSLLVACLNLGIVYAIAFKYTSTLDEIGRNAIMVARGNRTKSTAEPMVMRWKRIWRLLYAFGCMCLFIGFFFIISIGTLKITCGQNQNTASPPPPPATT